MQHLQLLAAGIIVQTPSVNVFVHTLPYVVACESIHPLWHLSYIVALQPGIQMYFGGGGCII
jgi:hypothetical protein